MWKALRVWQGKHMEATRLWHWICVTVPGEWRALPRSTARPDTLIKEAAVCESPALLNLHVLEVQKKPLTTDFGLYSSADPVNGGNESRQDKWKHTRQCERNNTSPQENTYKNTYSREISWQEHEGKQKTSTFRNIPAHSPITEDQTQQLSVTISLNKTDLHMLHFNEVDLAWSLDTVPNETQKRVKDLDQS